MFIKVRAKLGQEGVVIMRSLRVLALCVAAIGVMSVASSSASANNICEEGIECKKVTVKTCPVGEPCMTIAHSEALLLENKTSGEKISCDVKLLVDVYNDGSTEVEWVSVKKNATNNAKCETLVVPEFAGNEAWDDLICDYKDKEGKQHAVDVVEDVLFQAPVKPNTFSGVISAELTLTTEPENQFKVTAATVSGNGGAISGAFLSGNFTFETVGTGTRTGTYSNNTIKSEKAAREAQEAAGVTKNVSSFIGKSNETACSFPL
jgi:hypothetical protein